MSVKLKSITTSLIEEEDLSAEELIVYIARVSNPSNQLNKLTAHKLISYLIKHKHWSPFEFVDMTFEITTRRSVSAQILRHKSFSFQEFSLRYSEATAIQDIEIRKKAEKNRQSSLERFDPILDNEIKSSQIVANLFSSSINVYRQLINAGVAKEVARDVLPLATETTLYMKSSVRSWIHYLEIRTQETTQLEHRKIALQILDIFKIHFPNISKSLNL